MNRHIARRTPSIERIHKQVPPITKFYLSNALTLQDEHYERKIALAIYNLIPSILPAGRGFGHTTQEALLPTTGATDETGVVICFVFSWPLEPAEVPFCRQVEISNIVVVKYLLRDDESVDTKILSIIGVKRSDADVGVATLALERDLRLASRRLHSPDLRSYLVFGDKYRIFELDESGNITVNDEGKEHPVFVGVDPTLPDSLVSELCRLSIRHWSLK